ncbi:hypothetical protein H2198_001623 [Neophaeococcomyces mojaviensis]|uniref:Uncharacterized protein n=1 Tax=Neophaeococcomyces mojaviensis TaxID=3383035 RepID=A0ACC3AHI4_9EURO|nr:hypothetical protein H2198_001623 [Knufia sp. JES_112]
MPGHILAHLDCASPYSYFALLHLRRIRPILSTYGISISIIPIFLGGVNHATGNQPPSTLPAKAKFSPYDMQRAIEHFGTVKLSAPPFFPMVSLLPQRCMCVLKAQYPEEVFETVFERLWIWVFNKHVDLAKPENMKAVLLDGPELDEKQVDEIIRLAGTKEVKAVLNENTRRCIKEYGAFGAPWLWVVNGQGKGEPVFGSDRWVYVYRMLGLQFDDVKLKNADGTDVVSEGRLVSESARANAAKL